MADVDGIIIGLIVYSAFGTLLKFSTCQSAS